MLPSTPFFYTTLAIRQIKVYLWLMFGSLLSAAIKTVTLPLDAANAMLDVVTGGDGSKRSRNDPNVPNPLSLAQNVRDAVADAAEDIDD